MSKKELLSNLQTLIYKVTADNEKAASFKIRAYNDAIRIVKNYPNEIISDSDIEKWFIQNGKKKPGKIVNKIKEFIKKGYITEAKNALEDPRVKCVKELTKVYGIGPSKAIELYDTHNIQTIDDLKKKVEPLMNENEILKWSDTSIINKKQKLGLKYHDDLLERIPRAEMEEYNSYLKELCKEISPEMLFSINGSFRRNLPNSGDIDVLISGPDYKEYMKKLKKELKKRGIIKCDLANGAKKYMGVTCLPNFSKNRHMDIMATNKNEYPFAVLYFTGSGGFNVNMRAIALKKGYTMNEHNIYDKFTKEPVNSETIFSKIGKNIFEEEKDIFKFLEMDYVEPENRNNITISKLK